MHDLSVVGLDNRYEPVPVSEAAFVLTALRVFPADAVSGSAVES